MKALLVSTTPHDAVQDCLRAAGSNITLARNGLDAVRCAEHGSFDMAVIVSTGAYMDLVETYLHIRDLKPSMEIILFSEKSTAEQGSGMADRIASTFSNTHALNLHGLSEFLRTQSWPL